MQKIDLSRFSFKPREEIRYPHQPAKSKSYPKHAPL